MLRNTFFAVLAVLVATVSARAETVYSDSILTIDATPTPTPTTDGFDLSGTHQTWDITVTSTLPLQGFDFAGNGGDSLTDPDTYGFFGPMHQVNPAGNATVFTDSNGFFGFVMADVRQDSQFKFASNALTVIPGSGVEGDSILQANFAAAAPLGTEVALAQLVIPIGQTAAVEFRGRIGFATATGEPSHLVNGIIGGAPVIPEPSTLALLGLAMVGFVGLRSRS